MTGLLTNTQLSGRAGLLSWVNSVCSTQYPSVVSLRDGAAYCVIVDAAANRLSEKCASVGVRELSTFHIRAKRSSHLLNRIVWEVTTATCANLDPRLDGVKVRTQCEQNIQTLQIMLCECLPNEYFFEVDVKRLACGRLQDHMQLLKRMHALVNKILTSFSKDDLVPRTNLSCAPGSVRGVRMTRAVVLQRRVSQKILGRSFFERQKRENSVMRFNGRDNVDQAVNTRNACGAADTDGMAHGKGLTVFPKEHSKCIVTKGVRSIEAVEPGGGVRFAIIPDSDASLSLRHNSRGRTCNLSFSVSQIYCPLLEDLKQEVESYEALVQITQSRHQRSLLSCGSDNVVDTQWVGQPVETRLPKFSPVICLEKLGSLSKKRDKLLQALRVIHSTLVHSAAEQPVGETERTLTPPLLSDILAVLAVW